MCVRAFKDKRAYGAQSSCFRDLEVWGLKVSEGRLGASEFAVCACKVQGLGLSKIQMTWGLRQSNGKTLRNNYAIPPQHSCHQILGLV